MYISLLDGPHDLPKDNRPLVLCNSVLLTTTTGVVNHIMADWGLVTVIVVHNDRFVPLNGHFHHKAPLG